MKKFIQVSILALFVTSLVGVPANKAVAADCALEGQLVTRTNEGIYYLIENCAKRTFPNEPAVAYNGYDIINVLTISEAEFASYPYGENMPAEYPVLPDLVVRQVNDLTNGDVVVTDGYTITPKQEVGLEAIVNTKSIYGYSVSTNVDFYVNGELTKRAYLPPAIFSGSNFNDLFDWSTNKKGVYEIRVVIDPENVVAETNEDNNEYTFNIIVDRESQGYGHGYGKGKNK